MLTVLAVDDEPPALAELAHLLDAEESVQRVLTASDATEALRALESGDVDIAFLDIRMPGLSGLDLARILAKFRQPPAVVFVTAYEDHAVDAFDVGAVDYVMKPYRPHRLTAALHRAVAHRGGETAPNAAPEPSHPDEQRRERREDGTSDTGGSATETIPVERGGVTRFLSREDVLFVEAQGDYARLHTATDSHLVRMPISTLEERWSPAGFVRIHRSYLVPLAQVTELRVDSGQWTVLVAGRPLPVSRRHSRQIRDRLTGRRHPPTAGPVQG